jgi:hypothetical protein
MSGLVREVVNVARPSYESWGDGESVALVSSRLPVDQFASECALVFDLRYGRVLLRVFLADLLPSVAARLRPQGLRTYCAVDPSLRVRRWLVWSVPVVAGPAVQLVARSQRSVGRVCASCRGAFTVCGDGRLLTACPCGDCMPF